MSNARLTAQSINRNMLSSTVATVSGILFPLLMYTYVTGVLSVEAVGRVSFVQSFLQYFVYFSTLGISAYGRRECAKRCNDRKACSQLFSELAVLNVLLTVVALAALALCTAGFSHLHSYRKLILAMSYYVILSSLSFEWVYQAMGMYSFIMVRSVLVKAAAAAFTVFLVKTDKDCIAYGILVVFAASAGSIFNLLGLKKIVDFSFPSLKSLAGHFRPVLLLFSSTLLITLYTNFDIVMLSILSGDYETGLYNTVLKMKNIVVAISAGATDAIIPYVSYQSATDNRNAVVEYGVLSLRVVLLLTLPVAVFLSCFSGPVLLWLFGAKYLPAATVLPLSMVISLVLGLTNIIGNQLLVPLGGRKPLHPQCVFGMLVNFGLNALLIPGYGAMGAAIGTLCCEVWNLFYMGAGIKSSLTRIVKKAAVLKYPAVLCLIAPLTVWATGLMQTESLFLNCAIPALAFFSLYYLSLLLLKEPVLTRLLYRKKEDLHYENQPD